MHNCTFAQASLYSTCMCLEAYHYTGLDSVQNTGEFRRELCEDIIQVLTLKGQHCWTHNIPGCQFWLLFPGFPAL